MGERLRKARMAAGFKSAKAAADRMGISGSTYAAHENGQNEFDATAAAIYGRAFGVTASWLLTGEGAGPDLWRNAGVRPDDDCRAPFGDHCNLSRRIGKPCPAAQRRMFRSWRRADVGQIGGARATRFTFFMLTYNM